MHLFLMQEWTNEEIENEMDLVETLVKSIRSIRADLPANERL